MYHSSTTIYDYIIGKQVGQGAYATVRLAIHKRTGKKVAIKIYEKSRLLDPQRRKSVRQEAKIGQIYMYRRNFIVGFYGVSEIFRTPRKTTP